MVEERRSGARTIIPVKLYARISRSGFTMETEGVPDNISTAGLCIRTPAVIEPGPCVIVMRCDDNGKPVAYMDKAVVAWSRTDDDMVTRTGVWLFESAGFVEFFDKLRLRAAGGNAGGSE